MVLASPEQAQASHYIGHHWAHDGLARSQIYFVDRTGPNWPVATVTYRWNQASGVDSYYETGCPGSWLHCVDVAEYSANDGNYGFTQFTGWDAAGHNFEGVYVRLNNTYATAADQRRKTTCHEFGHALGLGHRGETSSCMMQGAAPPISLYPDQHDYDQLKSVYAHAN